MNLPVPLRNRWWVVAASLVGLVVNCGAILVFAFSVFLKPIAADLGWSRGALSGALFLGSTMTAIALPFVGKLMDKYGVQAVLMPGAALFALATAAMSLIDDRAVVLFGLYSLLGLVGAATTPIGYAKAVAAWFDKQRGLALGIAMAGVGLGVAVIPPITVALIGAFGWRMAWVGLAVLVFVLSFFPALVFVRDPVKPDPANRGRLDEKLPGTAARDAFRGWTFWALTIAFLLAVISINGTLVHMVALLTDRGIPLQQAAATGGVAGLAIIAGRIICGYCMDRFYGPYTAATFFVLPMIGILLLVSGAGGPVPFVGAVLCGLGIGAEVDLMGFFVSRYFGLRAFGTIYGCMFAIFSVGTGFGPFLMGASFDQLQSYIPMLTGFEVALVVCVALLARLGPYAYPQGAFALPGDAAEVPPSPTNRELAART
jgi:MFS family permease